MITGKMEVNFPQINMEVDLLQLIVDHQIEFSYIFSNWNIFLSRTSQRQQDRDEMLFRIQCDVTFSGDVPDLPGEFVVNVPPRPDIRRFRRPEAAPPVLCPAARANSPCAALSG